MRKKIAFVLVAIAIVISFIGATAAFAQAQTPQGTTKDIGTGLALWFLGQTATITFVVNFLKRNDFVRKHPKLVSALLNAVAVIAADQLFAIIPGSGVDDAIVKFLAAIASGFASSGWHEYTKGAISIVLPPK